MKYCSTEIEMQIPWSSGGRTARRRVQDPVNAGEARETPEHPGVFWTPVDSRH
jgi:hypothetical protein